MQLFVVYHDGVKDKDDYTQHRQLPRMLAKVQIRVITTDDD